MICLNSFTIAFFLYFSLLLAIGLMARKQMRTESDFVLGSRGLNFWLTALSAHASDMGSWLFMAFPVSVFLYGVRAIWIALGLIMGMALTWQFIAPRLRIKTEESGSYTLSSFLSRRFNDQHGVITLLTALLTLFFMTNYLAAGAMGAGIIFESVFAIDYEWGITFALAVVILYTMVGGYIAIAWTDCFQAIFLLSAVLLVPLALYLQGTDGAAIAKAAELRQISLALVPEWSFQWFFVLLVTSLGWGLGYFGMPHVLVKFMGLKDPKTMSKSKWVGLTWMVLALGGAFFVGLLAIGLFPSGLIDPQLLFVEEVLYLFPPLLAGFTICAIFAANLSTMDSQILVCASIVSEDLLKPHLRKAGKERYLLLSSRLAVLAVALVALIIALQRSATIQEVVQYAWSGLGCTFGPLVVAALYYKERLPPQAAIASLLVGGTVALVWPSYSLFLTGFDLMATVPGFCLSLPTIWLIAHYSAKGGAVGGNSHNTQTLIDR